jgi:hypothetical protein
MPSRPESSRSASFSQGSVQDVRREEWNQVLLRLICRSRETGWWLAEMDIVPDNRVKKEKVQRCTSERHDVPSFGVRLPVLWDMHATPIEGLPNILS